MSKSIKEVDYKCSNHDCGATQTLRYSPEEEPLPVTCCVPCGAGFGIDLRQMIVGHIGMFPQGKPRLSA